MFRKYLTYSFLLISFALLTPINSFGKERYDMLLSFGGSATNWTIAILQISTRKPVKSADPEHKFKTNRLRLELDESKPCLYRTHQARHLINVIPNISKDSHLLVLVRNPKEAILRRILKLELGDSLSTFITNFPKNEIYQRTLRSYMENLELYDSYKGPKQILYYEDLITYPKKAIKKLLAFFGEPPEKARTFLKKYDYYKELVIQAYRSRFGNRRAKTEGNAAIYYTKNEPKNSLISFDKLLEEHYPHLYNKYLKRFATPPQ